MQHTETIRLDTWLWAARFFKTRQLAKKAILGGKLQVNQNKPKVSYSVHINDIIEIHKDAYTYTVKVTGIAKKRASATIAQTLYQELVQSREKRQALSAELKLSRLASPYKKPEKRARKQLRDMRDK